jgi:hypothetical protein
MPDPIESIELVDLQAAREQLRIDSDDDDDWLQAAIWGVSRAVVQWCGGDVTKLQDDTGTYTLQDVANAVLVELAYQYANREGPTAAYVQNWYAQGYPLSAGCTAFLQPFHKPVCA